MLLYLRSATPGKPLPSVNLPQAFWPNFCRRFEKTPTDFLLCIFRITYKYEQIMPKTSDGFKLFCQNDLQKFATSAGKNLPASIPPPERMGEGPPAATQPRSDPWQGPIRKKENWTAFSAAGKIRPGSP